MNSSYQPIGGFALLVEGFSFFAGKYQTPMSEPCRLLVQPVWLWKGKDNRVARPELEIVWFEPLPVRVFGNDLSGRGGCIRLRLAVFTSQGLGQSRRSATSSALPGDVELPRG